MGNFFIKGDVDERSFVNKVMFYLWSQVLKDEVGDQRYFFKWNDGKEDHDFTFNDLFPLPLNLKKLSSFIQKMVDDKDKDI